MFDASNSKHFNRDLNDQSCFRNITLVLGEGGLGSARPRWDSSSDHSTEIGFKSSLAFSFPPPLPVHPTFHIIIPVFPFGTLRMFVPYSALPLHPVPPPQLTVHLLRLFVNLSHSLKLLWRERLHVNYFVSSSSSPSSLYLTDNKCSINIKKENSYIDEVLCVPYKDEWDIFS